MSQSSNPPSDAVENLGWANLLKLSRKRRVPIIRQIEASECGLACLAMVLGFHKHHVSLAELRARFNVSVKGSTLRQIIDWCDALRLVSRPLRLEPVEIKDLRTPAILHWNLDHFVVLVQRRDDGLVIHDPAVGRRLIPNAKVSEYFTGVALEIGTGPEFQRKSAAPTISLRKLAGSVEGIGAALRNIFGFAITLEVIALLMPQFMQLVVDQVLADADHDLLAVIGVSFVLLVIVQTAVSAFRTWAVVWLSTHFTMNWTGNVFQHLMKLPQTYFMKRQLGDIVARFGAISTIQQSLTTQMVTAILDGGMALATLVLLAIYSPSLCSIIVGSVGIYALLRVLYFRTFQEANLSQIVVNARQQSSLMESVRGVQTIRLNNQGGMRSARFLNTTAEVLNTSASVQKLTLAFGAMNGLTSGLQRVSVMWLGAWLALRGEMTAGMLMAFVSYADQFTARATAFADYIIQLRLLRLQGERLADIVLAPPEPSLHGPYQGAEPEPSIQFDRVTFRYNENEPWILNNATFEVKAGESIAIVGPSGCGKSTVLRLLLGLLDPMLGKVRVGGVDLSQLGKIKYRNMLGAVLQDDKLLAGSIADNISFFDDEASPERIHDAARGAQVHDDICAMPMGYHTLVGDMGSSLSGGQQQRIFLARALYKKPSILVLDEATSHLDLERERRISELLLETKVTRIIVAHRPETISTADRVLVLTQGQLVEAARPKPAPVEPKPAA